MSEWRDISTAVRTYPECRHAILVWCPQRQNIYCAVWDELDGCWEHFGGNTGGELREVPTHWQPLPAPPHQNHQITNPASNQTVTAQVGVSESMNASGDGSEGSKPPPD